MADTFYIRGRLRALAIPSDAPLIGDELQQALEDGRAQIILDQKNLIVNQGMSIISRFLGNNINAPLINGGSGFSTLSDITIGGMRLGSTVTPPLPSVTDTSSVGTLVYSPVLTVSYPTNFSIKFSGVVPITQLIGTTITEEANAIQFDHVIDFARS
jgi:hypothetical protein